MLGLACRHRLLVVCRSFVVLIIGQKTVSTPDWKTLITRLSHTLKVLGLLFRKEAHKLQNAGKESFRSFASNQVGNSAFSVGRMEAADSLRSEYSA